MGTVGDPVPPLPTPAPVIVVPTRWWQSWTHWYNAISLISGLLAAPEIVHLLGPVLGVQLTLAISVVANTLLRQLRTNSPIAGSAGETRVSGAQG